MNPYPRTWIDIDLTGLDKNLSLVREVIPAGCKVALVAKADAYGHGLIPVSRYVSAGAADWICVATVQEGLTLRDAGILLPILVISPILPVEAEQAVFYDLRVTVERLETAQALSSAATRQQKPAIVHVEVDTGLSRFGCALAQTASLLKELHNLPNLEVEGLCQHFVDSGHNPVRTARQEEEFLELVADLNAQQICPDWVHTSNSAGAFHVHDDSKMVRIGILAYGIDPYGLTGGRSIPILTWKARVTAIREVPAGATVSYSVTYQCQRPTTIATLGVGYGDGYPRSLSSKGVVKIHGQEVPVIGLVCMDQMLIDVTDAPPVDLGDEA